MTEFPNLFAATPRPAMERLEMRRLLADVSGSVLGFTLIDAQTDQPQSRLDSGATIDLATEGRQLSIRADLDPESAGSVRFNYDGAPNYRIDNDAPYSIAGEAQSGRDYLPWTPTLGTHTLIANSYSGPGGTGTRGNYRAITFTVIDSSPVADPIRINAGGGAYVDSAGNVFAADEGFSRSAAPEINASIAGTDNEGIYQSHRSGWSFTFTKTVPDGDYMLTLDFAEPSYRHIGQRRFNVRAEGIKILNNYDIVADAGKHTAVSKKFPVSVADGRLDLEFIGTVRKAVVSAIELIPIARTITVPAPLRVNAGGQRYVDSLSRAFDGDGGFNGGQVNQIPYEVDATVDDPLFYTYRSSNSFTFSRMVANGNYAMWLEFAEPTAAQAGQRQFDVWAEGVQVLDDYDIAKEAGPRTAVARGFNVRVADGALDLRFGGVVGDAIVSAIVLVPTDIPDAVKPYSVACEADDWRVVHGASNLRQIGQGMLLYSNGHKGRFPPNLIALQDEGYVPYEVFASTRMNNALPRGELSVIEKHDWVSALRDYIYLGAGRNNSTPEDVVLAYENPDRVFGGINILFGDGHVGFLDRVTAAQLIGFSSAGPTDPPSPSEICIRDSNIVQSQLNMRTIAQAVFLYANDFKGRFPPDLGTLYPYFNGNLATFVSPRGSTAPPANGLTTAQKIAWINASADYIYLGAGRRFDIQYDAVIAYENPSEMADGINILFGDGRIEFREMRWAIETLARVRAAGAISGSPMKMALIADSITDEFFAEP